MTKPNVQLTDILNSKAVFNDQEVVDKKELIKTLSKEVANILKIQEHIVFDVLWEREKLGTTGVGKGIAIPHGRIDGLEKVCGFFTRLSNPIAFDAVDDQPIDLVFLLLAPESAGADHLHALASVSRALRDSSLCEKLRKAKQSDLYNVLTETISVAAA